MHCAGGYGRAGTVLSCLVSKYGVTLDLDNAKPLSSDEAIVLVRKSRPKTIENAKQESFVKEFSSSLWGDMDSKLAEEGEEDTNMKLIKSVLVDSSSKEHLNLILRQKKELNKSGLNHLFGGEILYLEGFDAPLCAVGKGCLGGSDVLKHLASTRILPMMESFGILDKYILLGSDLSYINNVEYTNLQSFFYILGVVDIKRRVILCWRDCQIISKMVDIPMHPGLSLYIYV